MAAAESSRVVALWLPDWPVQAAHLASVTSQANPLSPVAIVGDSGVAACSPSARRAGAVSYTHLTLPTSDLV